MYSGSVAWARSVHVICIQSMIHTVDRGRSSRLKLAPSCQVRTARRPSRRQLVAVTLTGSLGLRAVRSRSTLRAKRLKVKLSLCLIN
jgi:hypothetical protein